MISFPESDEQHISAAHQNLCSCIPPQMPPPYIEFEYCEWGQFSSFQREIKLWNILIQFVSERSALSGAEVVLNNLKNPVSQVSRTGAATCPTSQIGLAKNTLEKTAISSNRNVLRKKYNFTSFCFNLSFEKATSSS